MNWVGAAHIPSPQASSTAQDPLLSTVHRTGIEVLVMVTDSYPVFPDFLLGV